MNLAQHVCQTVNQVTQPIYSYIAITVITICLLLFLIYKTSKSVGGKVSKIVIGCAWVIVFFFVWILESIAFFLIAGDDNPPSPAYHPLNAMVKYRCYYDNPPLYCPKTEKDVVGIAPDYLKSNLQDAHVTYRFYPENRGYTLIIRNNNYHLNNDRAVIFDPRLALTKGYYGIDFFDANIVDSCNGHFVITNPPPFKGPWNEVN